MERISPTSIINSFRIFDKDFWLSYKTLEKIMDPNRFKEIKMNLLRSNRIDNKYLEGVDLQQFEVEKQLLDQEWTISNEEAKQNGIQVHEKIREMFLTNDTQEFGIDTSVYKVTPQELFLNTDKGVFNELKLEYQLDDDITLVGIIDLLIKDGNSIKIIEFKSDDKIKMEARYDIAKKKKKTLKYPLNKIQDCSFAHYQLQLSIYAWLVQQLNPDFNIDCLEIWQIKDLKIKKKYPVEYIKDVVDNLMNWEVKSIKLKKEMDNCKSIQY